MKHITARALPGLLMLLIVCVPAMAELRPADMQHVKVYYEAGRYGGWPANHGIWCWGDEILVGFSAGWHKDRGPQRHAIDRDKPELHWLARSEDGGETWTVSDPGAQGCLLPEGQFLHGRERGDVKPPKVRKCTGGINFTHPDFALTVRSTSINAGESRFWYSYDRGLTWEGPFALPDFGAPGTAARTDYVVNGEHDCFLFITVAKENGEEGRPICVRTTDGGRTWELQGWIGPEPKGYAIMPATVRLEDGGLLSIIRRRDGLSSYLAAYRSDDDGRYWEHVNDPALTAEGNPASLIRLADGRLCMAYAYRALPFSIVARMSEDNGRTWSDEIILRKDGANRDLGYTRMVQRRDGKVVVVYYFCDDETGPERYIAATIFDPASVHDVEATAP